MPKETLVKEAVKSDRSRRGQASEDAIIDAVFALIKEIGYERTTVDAIAARARASKGTMYSRWRNKGELVAEGLRRRIERHELPNTGSLRGDLLLAMERTINSLVGRGGPSVLGLLEGLREDPTLRHLVRDAVEAGYVENGGPIAAQAQARGESVTVEGVTFALRVGFGQALMMTLFGGAPPTEAEQFELVDELLLHAARRSPTGERPAD
jgi:AcrR family transcriptional regulator